MRNIIFPLLLLSLAIAGVEAAETPSLPGLVLEAAWVVPQNGPLQLAGDTLSYDQQSQLGWLGGLSSETRAALLDGQRATVLSVARVPLQNGQAVTLSLTHPMEFRYLKPKGELFMIEKVAHPESLVLQATPQIKKDEIHLELHLTLDKYVGQQDQVAFPNMALGPPLFDRRQIETTLVLQPGADQLLVIGSGEPRDAGPTMRVWTTAGKITFNSTNRYLQANRGIQIEWPQPGSRLSLLLLRVADADAAAYAVVGNSPGATAEVPPEKDQPTQAPTTPAPENAGTPATAGTISLPDVLDRVFPAVVKIRAEQPDPNMGFNLELDGPQDTEEGGMGTQLPPKRTTNWPTEEGGMGTAPGEVERPGIVHIEGAVQRPGDYPLAGNMTVQDLLFLAGGLLPNRALLARADLIRRLPDHIKEVYAINLQAALSGDPAHNLPLQGNDVLHVYTWNEPTVKVQGTGQRLDDFTLKDSRTIAAPVQRSEWAGCILQPDGYILTALDNGMRTARGITVTLTDGREFTAKIVGHDLLTSVAVLKIEATDLPTLAIGDSEAVRVGQPIYSIGHPDGLTNTVTPGLVSGINRRMDSAPGLGLIQLGLTLAPGTSGGPVVDSEGRVIGLNYARTGTGTWRYGEQAVGISFALPINAVVAMANELIEHGKVQRAWLGVSVMDIKDAALHKNLRSSEIEALFGVKTGAVVSQVMDGSPAAKAGVAVDDVIVRAGEQPISTGSDLIHAIVQHRPGEEIELELWRNRQVQTVKVTLGEMPTPTVKAQPTVAPGTVPEGHGGRFPWPAEGNKIVTVEVNDVPLAEVLKMIAAATGLRVAVDPGVADWPVTMTITDVPAKTLLALLAELHHLEIYLTDEGVVVTARDDPQGQ